jgi:NAD(P)-dependent dehydrogenase (short-subunit alcohol dehydrogenase family)
VHVGHHRALARRRPRLLKQIVVAGGAGGVGEGIVRALLAAGDRVIVPSRSAAKLEQLRSAVAPHAERLVGLIGTIGDLEGARELRDRIAREAGRIDVLIPSLGGWWEGRLLDTPFDVWESVMDEMLRPHLIFANVFLPVLNAQAGGGRYIGIGGGAAYRPVAGSALVSIAGAAQLMLTRALHRENANPAVDILELVVDGPVRTRDSAALAADDWITADDVGRIVAELVAGGRTADPATNTTGPIVRMRPVRA